MIRLCLPVEPYWLDLSNGVRLRVRPLTTAIYEATRRKSTRLVSDLLRKHGEIQRAGGSVTGLPDLEDDDGVAGVSQYLFSQALANAAIVEWEGVGDANGNPVDVSEAMTAKLMAIPRVAEEFLVRYTEPFDQMVQEGNASRPLPSGTTAGVKRTAKRAAKKDPPAQKVRRSKARKTA